MLRRLHELFVRHCFTVSLFHIGQSYLCSAYDSGLGYYRGSLLFWSIILWVESTHLFQFSACKYNVFLTCNLFALAINLLMTNAYKSIVIRWQNLIFYDDYLCSLLLFLHFWLAIVLISCTCNNEGIYIYIKYD